MTNEQNVKIIESLYNAFTTRYMPTVMQLMDPAIE